MQPEDGTGEVEVDVEPGRAVEVEIALDDPVVVTSRVVDGRSGEPRAGLGVYLHPLSLALGRDAFRSATTDADGRFRIGPLEAGRYRGSVTAGGGLLDPDLDTGWVEGGPVELGDVPVYAEPSSGAEGTYGLQTRAPPAGRRLGDFRVVVSGVSDASPAAKAGLAAGDVIVSIDGHDATGPGWLRAYALILPAAGEEVTVGLADGRTVTLEAIPF